MDRLLTILDHNTDIMSSVAYVDDLAVVIEGSSRNQIEERANSAITILQNW